ncbi:MAG: hypothetical protein DI551_05300 [Micavibrio aeruginosavorus]|uniref:Transposase n=1 Tax=Micavibrio aeruginosavorus TaxID=349221 RepID=A0A2W5MYK3_9BACT|nr:MAG: hypothetical protein DI551_05300 [Micavibrio aeruginosavorus]
MIKEWFTAKEIAVLSLTGIPSTLRGVQKYAERTGLKSRPRNARGGGYEYHISSLPEKARMDLINQLVKIPENITSSIPQLQRFEDNDAGKTQEDKRVAKVAIVRAFEKFRNASGYTILIAEKPFQLLYEKHKVEKIYTLLPEWVFETIPSFSIQSLRRWRAHLNSNDAYKALGPKYGNRKGSGIIERAEDGKMKTFIIAAMLKSPHLTAGSVRDLCRANFGYSVSVSEPDGSIKHVELPNVRTFVRFMADWKKNNEEIHLRLTNPDAHKNRYQLALGKADAGIDRLNQVWEIDASPLDALCVDGRYSIYGIIDVYSRRVMYMVTKTAKTEAALLLIRRAIIEWGVPETIKTDNGSDFKSKRFMSALLSLGIEQDICPPYSGEKKPFIERSFHTLQHDLMPLLPGYIGHSVKDRKEIESRRSFAQRLGEDDAKTFAIELTHTSMQVLLNQWVEQKYTHRPHSGLNKLTPFQKVNAWTQPLRRIDNLRALDMLLAPVAGGGGYRVIGKKGIRLDGGEFYSAGLTAYIGKRVLIRHNPEDMGVIYCFTENDEFIAEARCIEREGVDPVAAAAAAKREQKRFNAEVIEPLRKEMSKITPSKMASDVLGLYQRENGNVTAFPQQSEIYTTPALAEASRATVSPLRPTISEEERKAVEKFQREFIEDKPLAKPTQMSDEDRWWAKAKALTERLDRGEMLLSNDAKWLEWAKTTHWYKAQSEFELMSTSTV